MSLITLLNSMKEADKKDKEVVAALKRGTNGKIKPKEVTRDE